MPRCSSATAWSGSAGRVTTGRSAPCTAAARASSSAYTSTTSTRTIGAPSPRERGSSTSCAITPGASAPTGRSTSWATAGASARRYGEEEHPAPVRVLRLRSVHARDRRVGPLSRDEGDRHAAVHGAAGRVRDRDPQLRSLWSSYEGFLVDHLMMGIALSMISGGDVALLYDSHLAAEGENAGGAGILAMRSSRRRWGLRRARSWGVRSSSCPTGICCGPTRS